MNINTDNYEAYLLDYMDGNLSPDETKQLQAFVAAQGLDWDELTEGLPRLEAPAVTYEGKESLKKKAVFVPLFARIAAAAAAIALLFALFWKPSATMPQQELMAELQPRKTVLPEAEEISFPTPKATTYQIKNQPIAKNKATISHQEERTEMPLLADLNPVSGKEIHLTDDYLIANSLLPDPMIFNFEPEVAFIEEEPYYDDDWEPSLIDRGVIRLTNGRYGSIGEMIGGVFHRVSHEVATTTARVAMTAYYKADNQIEEAKERWQEKRERKDEE